jgi:hypothetical protein
VFRVGNGGWDERWRVVLGGGTPTTVHSDQLIAARPVSRGRSRRRQFGRFSCGGQCRCCASAAGFGVPVTGKGRAREDTFSSLVLFHQFFLFWVSSLVADILSKVEQVLELAKKFPLVCLLTGPSVCEQSDLSFSLCIVINCTFVKNRLKKN